MLRRDMIFFFFIHSVIMPWGSSAKGWSSCFLPPPPGRWVTKSTAEVLCELCDPSGVANFASSLIGVMSLYIKHREALNGCWFSATRSPSSLIDKLWHETLPGNNTQHVLSCSRPGGHRHSLVTRVLGATENRQTLLETLPQLALSLQGISRC